MDTVSAMDNNYDEANAQADLRMFCSNMRLTRLGSSTILGTQRQYGR